MPIVKHIATPLTYSGILAPVLKTSFVRKRSNPESFALLPGLPGEPIPYGIKRVIQKNKEMRNHKPQRSTSEGPPWRAFTRFEARERRICRRRVRNSVHPQHGPVYHSVLLVCPTDRLNLQYRRRSYFVPLS
ncbi:hypothetical protein JTE90_014667 [Oedothorax gibbosus]|uniref:Uncharacterized protein n=1 Tax=Oedothorax gibbosus TaxID=931172 RepID=A0AAV6V9D5_9ARAC|nr:hypothetical protein JTE90_014667 [Oedothorax gibbosus]